MPRPDRIDLLIRPHIDLRETGDRRIELYLRDGDRLRLAYRATTGKRERLKAPMVFFTADGSGLDIGLSLAPAHEKVDLTSPVEALSARALLSAVLPGDVHLPEAKDLVPGANPDFHAELEELAALRQELAKRRSAAALAALGAGAPDEMAEGARIAAAHFRRLASEGAAEADLSLLTALYTAPGIDPGRLTVRALQHADEAVMLPIVDVVLDRLIAIGDDPPPPRTEERYLDVLFLLGRMPADRLAPRLDRIDTLLETRRGRDVLEALVPYLGGLGPEQIPRLMAYLQARIDDGDPRDGMFVAYRGLCMMGGAEGLEGYFAVEKIEDRLGLDKWAMPLRTRMKHYAALGLTDDQIRRRLTFDRLNDEARAKYEQVLTEARTDHEGDVVRWQAREVKGVQGHPCM